MRRLIFRRIASAELRAIGKSTKLRWGDEQAAIYVAELRDRIKSLREFPLRFPEFGIDRPGLRKMTCGHHVVFYLVTMEQVEIVRILHEAMDFEGRLGGGGIEYHVPGISRQGAKTPRERFQGTRTCWLITRLMPSLKVSMPKFIKRPRGRSVRRR